MPEPTPASLTRAQEIVSGWHAVLSEGWQHGIEDLPEGPDGVDLEALSRSIALALDAVAGERDDDIRVALKGRDEAVHNLNEEAIRSRRLRAQLTERDEELAATRRQYNDQLDRSARADAETTRVRYESDAQLADLRALVAAKDVKIAKVTVRMRPTASEEDIRAARVALEHALALTPADLRERAAAERAVEQVVEACIRLWDVPMTEESGLAFAVAFDRLKSVFVALPRQEGA